MQHQAARGLHTRHTTPTAYLEVSQGLSNHPSCRSDDTLNLCLLTCVFRVRAVAPRTTRGALACSTANRAYSRSPPPRPLGDVTPRRLSAEFHGPLTITSELAMPLSPRVSSCGHPESVAMTAGFLWASVTLTIANYSALQIKSEGRQVGGEAGGETGPRLIDAECLRQRRI